MTAEADNAELFEAISADFAARIRAGEQASISEYASKHPELAEEILELFPGIEAMEAIKGHRLSTEVRLPSSVDPEIDRLGEFAIKGEIGRGGMGIVYEAKQESLGRPVALKILPPSLFQNQDQVARFKREAETASRLEHEHIVPIFAVGQEAGIHFYAMQLIHGRGLDALFLDGSWLPKLADGFGLSKAKLVARIGLQVALALEHAHSRGVLHRDIKPSNLLVEKGGKVWVVDFGIAKVLDDQAMTRSGEFVGTLRYSPPEHFHGRFDGRSDLYSLGLTLHELLTGKPAFKGPGREALLRQVQEGDLDVLPKSVPDLPRDLATIVGKATALDADLRYQSAREMADDLSRFLADMPVLARETAVFERVYRWAKRNRAASAGLTVAVLALITASIVGWWAFLSTSASLERERGAKQLAESNLLFSLQAFDDLFDAIAGRDQALLMSDEGFSEVPVLPAVSEKDLDLLQRLLVFYDGFALENATNERLRLDRGRALRRVGDIHRWLGEFAAADEAYLASLDVYAEAKADDLEVDPMELAILHKDRGHALGDEGESDAAREEFGHAIRILLLELESEAKPRVQFELARVHNAIGALLASPELSLLDHSAPESPRRGRPRVRRVSAEVETEHRQAMRLAEDLLQEDPDNPELAFLRARSKRYLAQAIFRRGDVVAATALIAEAKIILEDLAELFGEVPDYRQELIESLIMMAALHPKTERAQETGAEAVEAARALAIAYPETPRYSELLARSLRHLGQALAESAESMDSENLGPAAQALNEAIDLRLSLWERFPYAEHHLWELVMASRSLAAVEQTSGNLVDAAEILELVLLDLEAEAAASTRIPLPVAGIFRDLASLYQEMGEAELSQEVRERARETLARRRR